MFSNVLSVVFRCVCSGVCVPVCVIRCVCSGVCVPVCVFWWVCSGVCVPLFLMCFGVLVVSVGFWWALVCSGGFWSLLSVSGGLWWVLLYLCVLFGFLSCSGQVFHFRTTRKVTF